MNARKAVVWTVCLVVVPAFGGAAGAAVIVRAGGIWDDAGNEISQWRTAGTAKTLDADGDNVYGSDAKLFYQVLGDYGTYVQYINSQTQIPPSGGYAVVDHPNDVSPDIQVRTTTSGGVAPGSVQNMFTFGIPGTPPLLGFRVGVAFDGLNGPQYSPQEIRLTQTMGGTATASFDVEPHRNSTLDMVFFDVTEAQVGDRFTVQGVAGPGGYATHQFVTWDSITAPLVAGDVIKLDFSTAGDGDGGSLFDWNQTTNAVAPILPGSVVRHGDGAPITGVGISFSGGGGGWNNDGNAGGWPGTAEDPYYVLGADDIYYGPGALTTMFTGLDPNLMYNVRIASLIGNNPSAVEQFSVIDADGTESILISRGDRWAAATLEEGGTVFADLRPDANGNLTVIVQNEAGSGGAYPLNAIMLEAVPEPGTWLLLLSALACGLLVRRRR